MTNVISFRNFDSADDLREFVEGYLETTIGHITQRRRVSASVVIEKKKSTKQSSHGHQEFICELILRDPACRNSIVAKKSSGNFYQSVKEACRAVEKSVRRMAQTQSKRRQKNYGRANDLEPLNRPANGDAK